MQKLTLEQIKFIDAYLQKSDVIFVDIRAELTDHVASAVEEKMEVENLDFYDAFKDFMIHNKKEILRNKNNVFPPLWSFARTLYKSYNIIVGLLIIALFYFISLHADQQIILRKIHLTVLSGIIIFALVQGIITIVTRKRYAYLEKVTFWLMIIYYINLISNGFYQVFQGSVISVGVVLFLFIAFLIYFTKTILKFKAYNRSYKTETNL